MTQPTINNPTATPVLPSPNPDTPSDPYDMTQLRHLHKQFSSALTTFATSPSLVHILHTYPPPPPSSPSPSQPTPIPTPLQTTNLLVLDSSFNPPSRAHRYVAISALRASLSSPSSSPSPYPPQPPPRLLLLLATANADKAPQPASFADRAVMMALLARSVHEQIRRELGNPLQVSVDVGVTKKAFFVGKAEALDEGGVYAWGQGDGNGDGGEEVARRYVQQTHLVGFDTLVRLFDRKYYGEEGLKALAPFLGRHRVRAMLRTATGGDELGREEERERQKGWLRGLKDEEGFREEWLDSVDVVEGGEEAEGVSSTGVREAVVKGDWGEVRSLVGVEVEGWVRERGLYLEEKEKRKAEERL